MESLLADSGTFVMETFPPGLEGTEAPAPGTPRPRIPPPPPSIRRPATPVRWGAAGGCRAPGGLRLPLAASAPWRRAAAAMHGSMSSSSGPAAGMPPAGMHGGAEMMMAGMTGGASSRSGKGVRYVVVRGVIPFRTQLESSPARSISTHRRGDAVLAIRRL